MKRLMGMMLLAAACGSAQQAPPAPAPAQGEAMSDTKQEAGASSAPAVKGADAQKYVAACSGDLKAARGLIQQIETAAGARTVASVLEPLNALWKVLDRAGNDAGLYRAVHPDPEVRSVADWCEQETSKIVTDLGLSRPLYEAVAAVDVSGTDAVTKRYHEHLLRDFRRAGVDRDEPTRQRIKQLNEELTEIGQVFDKNIREDVRSIKLDSAAELAGLPPDYIEAHKPGPDGKLTVTTDYPDYIPFMSYAKSDGRRLELYRVNRNRGYPQNEAVLQHMLERRHELATLLGYQSWATYITEDKMIKTETAAREFIDRIATAANARAKQDYVELLQQLQKELPAAKDVGDWQKTYIEEQVKKSAYDFDSQEVREYLAYAKVKQGVLDITSRMFGVQYVRVDVPVWDPSVEAYEMRDGQTVLGRFYLDMHPRTDKYKHAAAFPIRSGIGGEQIPEAALVCNFPGGDGTAGLMEHDDVVTFFHEFGHLIHHLFGGRQHWVGVSGFHTEWDFVEAPSQMLEEWAFDKTTLQLFATNAKGEPMPEALIAKMRRARDFGKGIYVKHQMFYAAVSLNYYAGDPTGIDTTAKMRELQARYSPFAYVDGTHFQMSFGHLDGYSAIYYTYMWSLVIAKDLFSQFEKGGMTSPDVAGRYRHFVLEPGGSKDAADMVRDFLGRPYTFESFEKWLNG